MNQKERESRKIKVLKVQTYTQVNIFTNDVYSRVCDESRDHLNLKNPHKNIKLKILYKNKLI